eukprot:TRINITY_DN1169_c0_g1_i2.p3 TRINITY_DN1169_c0_g1~~TRINITY_DN1169_c0_g1_i2.p3  ORF type:complete len:165 (+),score=9.91 TRINITY_DN1169_c0_g1_i2:556-1050(+)
MSPQLPRRVPLAILIPAILGAVLAPVAWYNWSSSWAPELVARLPAAVSGSSDTPALGSKGDTVDDSHFHWPSADDLAGLWISSDEASRMLWAMKPGMIYLEYGVWRVDDGVCANGPPRLFRRAQRAVVSKDEREVGGQGPHRPHLLHVRVRAGGHGGLGDNECI